MKNKIKAVIFDIGNTLIDATSIAEKALTYTAIQLKNQNLIESTDKFCKTYKDIDKQVEGIDVNHLYSGMQILIRVAEKLNLKQRHFFYYNFISIYRKHVKTSISHNVSARKVFAKLKGRNIKIGILSDGTTYEQIEQLHLLGILDYIDEIVTSQELMFEKPHPKTFSAILDKLKCSSENSIMVGDDILRDINGAKKIGMTTVLITKYLNKDILKTKTNNADYTITTINELFKILNDHGK